MELTHNPQYPTREEWLLALTNELRPVFAQKASPIPDRVRLSCGFPSSGARGKAIGECWSAKASADAHFEIFIKPSEHEAMEVAAIVVHELIHAAVGLEAKHGPLFRKAAVALGLKGKMTATVAGEECLLYLEPIVQALGRYPHDRLSNMTKGKERKKDKPWKNVNCPACGYRAEVRVEDLERARLLCPVDGEVMLTKEERAEGGFE